MSSEERQQGEAVLFALIALSFWLSHETAIRWPDLPGNLDLQPWIEIWNKPIPWNWPCGLILAGFMSGLLIFVRRSRKNLGSERNPRTSRRYGKIR